MTGDGQVHRGAGHGRGRRVQPRRARLDARSRRARDRARSSTCSASCWRCRPEPRRRRDAAASSSPPRTPTRPARSSTRSPGLDVELVAAPGDVPEVEETGTTLRRERPAQGGGAARRDRRGRARRRHRPRGRRARRRARRLERPVRRRGRHLRRQRREARRRDGRGAAQRAHRPVPDRRSCSPAPTARSSTVDGVVEGVIADAPRGDRGLRLRPGVRPGRRAAAGRSPR